MKEINNEIEKHAKPVFKDRGYSRTIKHHNQGSKCVGLDKAGCWGNKSAKGVNGSQAAQVRLRGTVKEQQQSRVIAAVADYCKKKRK